jgi:hypothetical protein
MTTSILEEFNQNQFDIWEQKNNYDLIQLFDCLKYNFKDVLPYNENEWKKDEEEIFDIFCRFIYEYS